MKVLLLTSERGMRGGEMQLALLADGLFARGHEPLLVAPPGAELIAQLTKGVRFHPLRARNDLDLLASYRLQRLIRMQGPDLVHAFTARSQAIASRALHRGGPPLIVSRTVSFPAGKGFLGRRKYRRVMHYAAVSRTAAESLRMAGVPPNRIRIIPSAVPPLPDPPSADRARESFGLSNDSLVVGAVSHLESGKGFSLLLRAVAPLLGRFPNLELLLVGEGPALEPLRVEAEQLGLGYRLKLPGPAKSRLQVATSLAALDLFVLPSLSEGMPTALLEAMMVGVPVVASAVGGIPDLLEQGNLGWLIPANDVAALSKAIEVALVSGEGRDRFRARAWMASQRYAPSRIVDAYLQLYERVLAKKAIDEEALAGDRD